jgi:hypothetical protein
MVTMLDERGISNFKRPPIRLIEPSSAAERVSAATASEKVKVRAFVCRAAKLEVLGPNKSRLPPRRGSSSRVLYLKRVDLVAPRIGRRSGRLGRRKHCAGRLRLPFGPSRREASHWDYARDGISRDRNGTANSAWGWDDGAEVDTESALWGGSGAGRCWSISPIPQPHPRVTRSGRVLDLTLSRRQYPR